MKQAFFLGYCLSREQAVRVCEASFHLQTFLMNQNCYVGIYLQESCCSIDELFKQVKYAKDLFQQVELPIKEEQLHLIPCQLFG